MSTISIATYSGAEKAISPDVFLAFRSGLRGATLLKEDEGYHAARAIWNGMVDRYPALIVRCRGAADVMRAVDFAREHEMVIAVRSGGHNIAGNAVCEGGMMIDLSGMDSVRVDPVNRKAWVGPGATLGHLDRETQAFGLVVPTGINSTTGIAGLTLGGGFGWTTRKFGLTIDNLVSADVVTADGKLVRASKRRECRSLLGDPRRRRQFRHRHELRVQPSPAGSAGAVGLGGPPVRARRRVAQAISCRGGRRTGRTHLLGGHAQGAAAAIHPGGVARTRGPDLRDVLRRRSRRRRKRQRGNCARSVSRSPTWSVRTSSWTGRPHSIRC